MYIFGNMDEKRHGSIIQGQKNTGKTMLMSLLLEGLNPTRIAKNSEGGRFQFIRLTSTIVLLYVEPMITCTNVNMYRSLLGEIMETVVQNESHQTILIPPWLITTNQNVTHNIERMDANAMNSRIIRIGLNLHIRDHQVFRQHLASPDI